MNRFAKKPIYENCIIYHPDGRIMFRCSEKKVNWYLARGLAEKVSENPLSAKLTFTPKGNGFADDSENLKFGIDPLENKCVNCASKENLTRHHIVPRLYRKHIPEEYKSNKFEDIVIMCNECHQKYEKKADELKAHYRNKFNIKPNSNKNENNVLIRKYRNALNNKNIPEDRRIELLEKIKQKLSNANISIDNLLTCKIKNLSSDDEGRLVVERIKGIVSDFTEDFIISWRLHFLENNSCTYMPETWKNKISCSLEDIFLRAFDRGKSFILDSPYSHDKELDGLYSYAVGLSLVCHHDSKVYDEVFFTKGLDSYVKEKVRKFKIDKIKKKL